jgi:large subunit ribosomal protein L24
MHVKKGDKVIVIAGKDKGKSGTILRAFPSLDKVLVDGVNIAKKHKKKTRTAPGSMVEVSVPIHVSNVKLADKKVKGEKTEKPAKKVAKKVANKTTKE